MANALKPSREVGWKKCSTNEFRFYRDGFHRLATPEDACVLPGEHDAIGVDPRPDRRKKPRKETGYRMGLEAGVCSGHQSGKRGTMNQRRVASIAAAVEKCLRFGAEDGD